MGPAVASRTLVTMSSGATAKEGTTAEDEVAQHGIDGISSADGRGRSWSGLPVLLAGPQVCGKGGGETQTPARRLRGSLVAATAAA